MIRLTHRSSTNPAMVGEDVAMSAVLSVRAFKSTNGGLAVTITLFVRRRGLGTMEWRQVLPHVAFFVQKPAARQLMTAPSGEHYRKQLQVSNLCKDTRMVWWCE